MLRLYFDHNVLFVGYGLEHFLELGYGVLDKVVFPPRRIR
jgi:hypothetical protein